MKSSGRVLTRAAIAIVALLLAMAGFLSLWRLMEERDRGLEAFRTGSWIAVQAEIELLRLIDIFGAFHHGEAVDKSEVLHRFEIFWSRVPLLLEGDEGVLVRRLVSREEIERIFAQLPDVERSLAAFTPGDDAAYQVLRTDLEDMRTALHDLVLNVMAHTTSVQNRERLIQNYAEIFTAFSLVILCGGVLLLMLLRELRESSRLLEQSRRAERDAAEANASKSRFLAAASHDLRQPLNALSLLLGLLQTRVKDKSSTEMVEKAQDSVTQITRQLDTYLNLTKLDTGRIAIEPTAVHLAPLFERIAATFKDEADRKGLRLRIVGSRAHVTSDAFLLERILANLVSNAVRYTERGSVLIGSRRRGDAIRIDVLDTGPGIEPEFQAAIFDEFYQVSNRERAHGDGYGLGLAIVRRLVRLLDHRLELRSIPGRGSCFSLTLPIASDVDAQAAAPPQTSKGATTESQPPAVGSAPDRWYADRRGFLVVIVENDNLIAMSMALMIEEFGCRAVTAASAEQAVDLVREKNLQPQLIIADYRLRGRTGIEAIADLRKLLGADIPAWIITGDTGAEVRTAAATRNIGYLSKPISTNDLRKVVANLERARFAG